MTVRALAPGGADGNHPLLAFLDRHGMLLLLTEVAVLAVVSFLAMGTDRYWRSAEPTAATNERRAD